MINFLLLGVVILAAAAGDVSFSRGMKMIGGIELRLATLRRMARRLMTSPFIGLGLFCHSIAFSSFLALLARADLSWVVPATAISFVVETLAAKYLLSEQVSRTRWAGALCVSAGVILISF
ncbi:MAG: hypothetical protein HY648_13440 [Acidobacteria bacterium]|nr:hypothetical protein [Acidobacteriota bacterium]